MPPRTYDHVLTAGDPPISPPNHRRRQRNSVSPSSSRGSHNSRGSSMAPASGKTALRPTLTFGTDNPFDSDDDATNGVDDYDDNSDSDVEDVDVDDHFVSTTASDIDEGAECDDSHASHDTPRQGNGQRRNLNSSQPKDSIDALQDMIDSHLDPDSVDFQPLLTSINGAAMTAPHHHHHHHQQPRQQRRRSNESDSTDSSESTSSAGVNRRLPLHQQLKGIELLGLGRKLSRSGGDAETNGSTESGYEAFGPHSQERAGSRFGSTISLGSMGRKGRADKQPERDGAAAAAAEAAVAAEEGIAYDEDSTAYAPYSSDEESGVLGYMRSAVRGITLLFRDVASLCLCASFLPIWTSLRHTVTTSIGPRLVFAAGWARMMLTRGYGAASRFGKNAAANLGSSLCPGGGRHGERAALVGGSGGGGRRPPNSSLSDWWAAFLAWMNRNFGGGGDLPNLKTSFGFCLLFFVVVTLGSVVRDTVSPPSSSGAIADGRVSLSMKSNLDELLGNLDLSAPGGVRLPRPMDAMAEVSKQPLAMTDTPVFWSVPRSGGSTMMSIASTCFAKVVASEVGELDGHATDETLQIIATDYGNFVNVDTTRPHGIQRAKKLGLVGSRIAGVIFSPHLHEISSLFDGKHEGRFFTMLRDPVTRIVSMYYYQKVQNILPAEDTSIEQFVAMEENWMVRILSNKMTGKVGPAELNVAKEILRRKFLLGLWEEKTESLRRIEQYFGWKLPSPVAQNCKNDKLYFEWNNKNPHPGVENEDALVLQIQKINRYDIELYAYAKQLFKEQENLFWGGSRGETGNLRR